MPDIDPFDLSRFVTAQAPVIDTVIDELRTGRKRTHWMWFIFPQLQALGRSSIAKFYGIGSLKEAQAYLNHAVLADRLKLTTRLVLDIRDRSANDVLGYPDDLKFRSSMTLFSEAAGHAIPEFDLALKQYFDGKPDDQTIALL